ncbi:MAG: hypothetical protein ACREFD_13475, partial [Stellaceae bacterium]
MIDPTLTAARFWRDVGNDVLLGGIGAEIVLDILWPEKRRERLKKIVIVLVGLVVIGGIWLERTSGDRVDNLSNDIQEAQRSKIISLDERLAARRITDRQEAELTKDMRPFSGQVFIPFGYFEDKESWDIINQIAQALIAARWKYVPSNSVAIVIAQPVSNSGRRASVSAMAR